VSNDCLIRLIGTEPIQECVTDAEILERMFTRFGSWYENRMIEKGMVVTISDPWMYLGLM
jgi:hypothetical protein